MADKKKTAKVTAVKDAKVTATKKKAGRPKKVINQRQFEQLCEMQCTRSEIAAFFDCDDTTIVRWCHETYGTDFATICKKKADCGKTSLRHIQFKMAQNGSERMAIWLGRQWLGQTDKTEIAISEISDDTRAEIEDFLNDNGTNTDPAED